MSDSFVHDDNLIANALRLNWDHARHIEGQRVQIMAVYVAIAIALGFVSIHPGDQLVRIGAALLGLLVTLLIWAMTHKLNNAFANQIWAADLCARRLAVQSHDGRTEFVALHGFVGFPRKAPGRLAPLRRINMRLMFNMFYATLALAWLVFAGYLLFRIMAPAAVL